MPDNAVKMEREGGFLPEAELPEAVETSTDASVSPEQTPEMPAMESQPVGTVAAQHEQPANNVDHFQVPKDELLEKIEQAMSAGLADVYNGLPADKKVVFKSAGEQAAKKIQEMIATGKVKRHATMKLLSGWLKTIPKVNRYFLEQEVKLKTDDIQDLAA